MLLGGHRLGAALGQGIGVTEAGQGVSLQGMAQGTMSPGSEGPRVTIKRLRNGSGFTWKEVSKPLGGFL